MSRKMPTQDDVREQGRCGHGFNYGGPGGAPRYCGQPSEPDAAFGDCPEHAREFRSYCAEIDRQDRRLESADCIERGLRALNAEWFENRPDTAREEVTRRARQAQERASKPTRTRRRSR